MLSVNLVVVGSLKEKFYKDAESEFLKRSATLFKILTGSQWEAFLCLV